jgi:DNA-binding NarL/FixJ family response regulator
MIRILLVDDHVIVREGLKRMFETVPEFDVVCEAQNAAQLMECLRETEVDILLLDLSMPGLSGIDLIARVQANYGLPMLVLTMHNELQIAKRAIKAGALGFVTKDCEPEILFTAVRKVAAGGRYVAPELAEQMAFEKIAPPVGLPHDQLSARELYILRQLVNGKSINEIAGDLSISNKTVSTHKARLMQKMNFVSNAEMVRYGIAHGLVE